MNVAVLASTRGTTLGGLLEAQASGALEAKIVCVITDRACGALDKAKTAGVDAILIDRQLMSSREEFEQKADDELAKRGVELICLAGFMRILSPAFVRKWSGRLLNAHPSLLPKFAGGMDLRVHEAVLAAGEKESGVTVHFVEEGVDTGEIVGQKKVPVVAGDTPESLKERVQEAEKQLYLQVINEFARKMK